MPVATSLSPTHQDVLGPFWLPGAPVRQGGVISDEMGVDPKDGVPTKLVISGTVRDQEGQAISGAVLDFWSASPPHADDGLGYYDTNTFNYRGKVIADQDGNYSAQTVIPGHYPLNGFTPDGQPEDGPNRPEHIHLMVIGPDDKVNGAQDQSGVWRPMFDSGNHYQGLVTQLYFKDDGDTDHGDQSTDQFFNNNDGAARALDLHERYEEGWKVASGKIDVVLQKA